MIIEKDNVKVAFSLNQTLQEILDGVDRMKELEAF